MAPTYESLVPKSVVRVMTGLCTAGGSEDTGAGYRQSEEDNYQRNRKPEELQLQTAPRSERVVRSAKQTGALPFHLEQYDCHQENRDKYLDDVENRHIWLTPNFRCK